MRERHFKVRRKIMRDAAETVAFSFGSRSLCALQASRSFWVGLRPHFLRMPCPKALDAFLAFGRRILLDTVGIHELNLVEMVHQCARGARPAGGPLALDEHSDPLAFPSCGVSALPSCFGSLRRCCRGYGCECSWQQLPLRLYGRDSCYSRANPKPPFL